MLSIRPESLPLCQVRYLLYRQVGYRGPVMPIQNREDAIAKGRKGGVSRARKLSTERRSAIARQAALARWSRTPALPAQDAPRKPKSPRHAA